jgi:AcrR family transcriptional regulator
MGRTLMPDAPPGWPDTTKGQLMLATALVASERGYAQTSVVHVLERLGASRRTFYVYFGNLEDCFFAAYDAIVADVRRVLAGEHGELTALLDALFEYFAAWPAHARVLMIEVLATGPAGAERHERTMAMLACHVAACEVWQPGHADGLGREDLAQATLGAILRIVQRTLLTEGPEALSSLGKGVAAIVAGVSFAELPV